MVSAAHQARLDARREGHRRTLAAALPPDARCVLEIGCGHGHFLTAYAERHRDRLCVGIDLIGERVGRALKKRDRAGLANLQFFKMEAREFLDALPPGIEFADVYLLFPDPWPKKRHHKHRLLQAGFLSALAARTAPGSRLFFRTDHRPYFDAAAADLAAHPDWRIQPSQPWPFETPTVFQQRAPGYQSLIAARANPGTAADKAAPPAPPP